MDPTIHLRHAQNGGRRVGVIGVTLRGRTELIRRVLVHAPRIYVAAVPRADRHLVAQPVSHTGARATKSRCPNSRLRDCCRWGIGMRRSNSRAGVELLQRGRLGHSGQFR